MGVVPAIHVRNVPESIIFALRERAQRRGRSMQQDILEILQAAASEPIASEPVEPIHLITVRTPGRSTWRREDIYDDEGR
jgi:plasmid stability protein